MVCLCVCFFALLYINQSSICSAVSCSPSLFGDVSSVSPNDSSNVLEDDGDNGVRNGVEIGEKSLSWISLDGEGVCIPKVFRAVGLGVAFLVVDSFLGVVSA